MIWLTQLPQAGIMVGEGQNYGLHSHRADTLAPAGIPRPVDQSCLKLILMKFETQSAINQRAMSKIKAHNIKFGDPDIISFLHWSEREQEKKDECKICNGEGTVICPTCSGSG